MAVRKELSAFNSVIELANISRPRMFMHSLEGSRVETGNIFAVALRVAVEKMVRQKVDVLAAVTQGRDVNLDGIQAKEEILPEPARSRLRIYLPLRRREASPPYAP